MKGTVKSRLLDVQKSIGGGQTAFVLKTGCAADTYQRLKNGGELRSDAIKKICDATGYNFSWVMTGEGEKMKSDAKEIDLEKESLRSEVSRLQKEIDRLWQLIGHDRKVNFHKASDHAGAKVIPLKKIAVAYSGAKTANG
jgi:hypothetical protein